MDKTEWTFFLTVGEVLGYKSYIWWHKFLSANSSGLNQRKCHDPRTRASTNPL
jgi:hypothetical protein